MRRNRVRAAAAAVFGRGEEAKVNFFFVNNDNLSRICIQTDTFDPRHLRYSARADLCLI